MTNKKTISNQRKQKTRYYINYSNTTKNNILFIDVETSINSMLFSVVLE